MSITSILQTAVSGLNTNQQALRTTSNNITNVNTEGFVRRTAEQQSRVSGNQLVGVEIAEIRRVVDRFLERELLTASAETSRFEGQMLIHDQIQALLGRPDLNTSLSGKIDTVFKSLADLGIDPSSQISRIDSLNSLREFTIELNRLAQETIDLRVQADFRIEENLKPLNQAIQRIADLNPLIAREALVGGDTTGLQEQRAAAVTDIAKYIDVSVQNNSDSTISVSTSSGLAVVDETAHIFKHLASGTVSAVSPFSPITIHRVNPVSGIAAVAGSNADSQIGSGELRGLLEMRDGLLPDLGVQLGELAAQLSDQMNAVHNDNTAVPPPNSLTGRNTGLAATDAHNFTGVASFSTLDANNEIVNSVTVDFGAIGGTMADVLTAVNGTLGAGTMTLTNGVLAVQAGVGEGIAVVQDTTTPSARGTRGFAHFFGLNDLLNANVPLISDTGFAGTEPHGFTAGETVDFVFDNPDGLAAVTYTMTVAGASFNDLLTDLNGAGNLGGFMTFSLSAQGQLVVTPKPGFEDHRIRVSNDSTNRNATGLGFSDIFTVGESYRSDIARTLVIDPDIADNQSALALAKLDPAAAAGTPAVTLGDNRGALALQNLEGASISFGKAGGLNAISNTLGGFAATILANTGGEAALAEGRLDDGEAFEQEMKERVSNVSGVNLDEELANMIVFQNSYNAAARLVTTAQELLDTLLNAVR